MTRQLEFQGAEEFDKNLINQGRTIKTATSHSRFFFLPHIKGLRGCFCVHFCINLRLAFFWSCILQSQSWITLVSIIQTFYIFHLLCGMVPNIFLTRLNCLFMRAPRFEGGNRARHLHDYELSLRLGINE